MKSPVPELFTKKHDPSVTGVPEIVQVVSEEDIEPVAFTRVEGGPAVGISVMFAEAVTVNSVWAESPIGLPLTVMTYAAGATFLTTKVAVTVMVKLSMAQAPLLTGVPDTEQVVSLEAKSELFVMVTEVPGGPEEGIGVLRAG